MSQADQIDTLDLQLPVYLPGQSRDWHSYAGIAKISKTGDIIVKLQDKRAAVALIDMAVNHLLLAVSFDYKLTQTQIKEMNERYTKKIVSRVGSHPVLLNGKDVGTAYIYTDGTIQIKTENDDQAYVVDTNVKKDYV